MQAILNHRFLKGYFGFIRKCIPKKPDPSSIGLDIGAGECKLVEIIREDNGYKLLNCQVEKLDKSNEAESLKQILTKNSAHEKAIFTSVFGKGTLIRYISMPRMTLEELRNSFGIESDKYFPFAQDQVYTDCFILDEQGGGKEMSVMAAASKKEIIDQRLKLLQDAGFTPELIGINPVALANVINVLGWSGESAPEGDAKVEDKKEAIAVLDMGDSVSNLTIIDERLPRFTRDIYVGGRDLTRSISNTIGIGIPEAEALKRSPADRLEEVLNATAATVNNMTQELKLSFDYFVTERNKEVKHLLLTGGGSMLKGINSVFEKSLEVRTSHWNPLESVKPSDSLSQEQVEKAAYRSGVALGLALYAYD